MELHRCTGGSDLQRFSFGDDAGRYTYGNGHGHPDDDGTKHVPTTKLASNVPFAITVVRIGIAVGVYGGACSITRNLRAKMEF